LKKLTILFLVALLSGCASLPAGVKMTSDEAAACKEQSCTVWTDAELRQLAEKFFTDGYKRGAQSSGRAL
jgi:uncharacterized protein YceK